MATAIFKTTRFKRGNFLFPAMIEVTDQEVVCVKRYGLFRRKNRISIKNIASIHVKNFQFSSEILFKNLNGGASLTVVGVRKSDARAIREMVERTLGV